MKLLTTRYNISSNKLSRITIAHLSDIHFHHTYNTKRLDIILDSVKELNPNYICITGDIVDNKYVLDNEIDRNIITNFIKRLGRISSVILTLGNHEMYYHGYKAIDIKKYHEIRENFKNVDNVIVLDNEIYTNNNINFIGYNPPSIHYKKKEKDMSILVDDFNNQTFKINNTNYNVLLIHTPKDLFKDDVYNNLKQFKNIDLILSGHTHGGMLPNNLKGHFGLISPGKKLFPKNIRGILVKENQTLIISSGIIRLSHASGVLRHFNDIYKMSINYIEITNN